jgi:glycosyltransferase involved in cell wall biosynthesis
VGRVDPLKLGRPPVLERFKDLRTLVVGANNEASFPDYLPRLEWVKNATIQQLANHLSHAKVYVHWKGLLDRSGPEHFGITIAEALASGVPVIVPKAGGAWSDIAEEGKYCIGINSVDEGVREATRLCTDKEYWQKYHNLAIEGVKRFGYDTAAEKLAKWLKEIQ